jgi:cytochrome c peroxidase
MRTTYLTPVLSVLSVFSVVAASLTYRSFAAEFEPRLRRPIALHLSADERFLLTANQRSGSISVVDLSRKAVVRELAVGERLSALAPLPNGRLITLDEARHELILLRRDSADVVEVVERLPVASYPVDVAVSASGEHCFVTSLWSRRLTAVELPPGGVARVVKTIDLPFAPRKLLLVRGDSRLIVADAFGGRVAIVDPANLELLLVREFPAHNIRGLAVSQSGQMLLVSHQMLNELAHTVQNDVHWGLLMSNDLRWIKLDALLEANSDLYRGAHMHPLGEAGNATSDPAGVAVAATGLTAVTLSGVDQVAIGKESDFSLSRLKVGKRPTAIVFSADGQRAYTANTFGDSVSIVDIGLREQTDEITLGPQPELSLIDRGELLFYDGRLSRDGWMSCHSCHTDGHTNGQLNDNFSDGSFGAAKRVLSLLGVAGTAPLAWDASAADLATQLRKSLTHTMQIEREPKDGEIEALIAYVHSLPPPPGIDKARNTVDDAAIERGRALFAEQKCASCHEPPAYTTARTYDVGLHDKLGNKAFNPPSLIGVGQRGPYFHDSRAKELADVFAEHGHQLQLPLDERQVADLLAFLRSL